MVIDDKAGDTGSEKRQRGGERNHESGQRAGNTLQTDHLSLVFDRIERCFCQGIAA